MTYDLQQRIFFVKSYNEKKITMAVQRAFKVKYQVKVTPSRTSILGAVKNFKKTGNVTFVDPRKGIKSAKRVEAKNQLVPILEENPSISSRKAASAI